MTTPNAKKPALVMSLVKVLIIAIKYGAYITIVLETLNFFVTKVQEKDGTNLLESEQTN